GSIDVTVDGPGIAQRGAIRELRGRGGERQGGALGGLVGAAGTGTRRGVWRPDEKRGGAGGGGPGPVVGRGGGGGGAGGRAEGGDVGVVVALVAAVVGADAGDGPHLQVLDEHISLAVGVARHQVVGVTGKGDVAAVRADRGAVGVVVGLVAAATGAGQG